MAGMTGCLYTSKQKVWVYMSIWLYKSLELNTKKYIQKDIYSTYRNEQTIEYKQLYVF